MDERERSYMKFETKLIRIGEEPNVTDGTGDVVIPIHLSSTFARKEVDKPTKGYEYSRSGNPTRNALEKRLAALENARYGLAFASGLAAETTLCLTLLRPNDHVIVFDDVYGGCRRLFENLFKKQLGVSVSYVDARNTANVETHITGATKLIWLETPTNPLMKLCDIRAITEIARQKKIMVVVDNTFMSPYFQNPLDLGAHVVMHSTTKYLNGHSDSLGGALMVSDDNLFERLKFNQNAMGAILSPFDSYLLLRGLKTLALRMDRHQQNAMKVATYLEKHKKVQKVYHPGLESHPQHSLAKKQMRGYSGTFSFELGGNLETAKTFLKNLKELNVAESLGGVESLIEHPALMTHASIPKEEREKVGISDSLIRISVGIEHVDDILEDIESALKKI